MKSVAGLFYKSLGYGCRRSQRLFEKLYSQAIYGMNYANPAFETNGEIKAMAYVHRQLSGQGVQKPVIFDVGANIGDYALALQSVFTNASIHCFEPGAAAHKQLKSSTEHFDNIFIHDFGFGETDNTFTLFLDAPLSKTASLYDLQADHEWKGSLSEQIKLKTIDGFCGEASIDRINFLKIDVEGHELPVLRGAISILEAGKADFIQFEFGFRQIDSRTYFRDFYHLLNKNYRLHRILKDGLVPIDKYHEGLEIFVLVSNFLAERRQ